MNVMNLLSMGRPAIIPRGTTNNVNATLKNYGNNTILEIDNDGTSYGLYLHQDGVLASDKYALYVYSGAAQTNSPLIYIWQDNTSSTEEALSIRNDGSGKAIIVNQVGTLATGTPAVDIYSATAQSVPLLRVYTNNISYSAAAMSITQKGTGDCLRLHQYGTLASGYHGLYVLTNVAQSQSLVRFETQDSGNTGPVAEIVNVGTGHGLYVNQSGVLASSKYALYVYSNAAQTSNLVRFQQDNSSSSGYVLYLANKGTGHVIYVNNFNEGRSLLIIEQGRYQGNRPSIGVNFYPYTTNAISSEAFRVYSYENRFCGNVIHFDMAWESIHKVWYYDGTSYTDRTTEAREYGHSAFTLLADTDDIFYVGFGAKFDRLYFDLSVAGAGLTLVWEYWNGSAWTTLTVTDGTSDFSSDGWVTWSEPADWATTDVNGYTAYYVRVRTTTAPTTVPTATQVNISVFAGNFFECQCYYLRKASLNYRGNLYLAGGLYLGNGAEGEGIQTTYYLSQNGGKLYSNMRLEIDNDSSEHGLYLYQDGVLNAGRYALYVYSNAIQTNAALVRITQDNSSSTKPCVVVRNDGTGNTLYLINYGSGYNLVINQYATLSSGKNVLTVYDEAAQTNSPVVYFQNVNTSTTKEILKVQQNGTTANTKIQTWYAGTTEVASIDIDGDLVISGKLTEGCPPDYGGLSPLEYLKQAQHAEKHRPHDEVHALTEIVFELLERIEQLEKKIGGIAS